MTHVLPPDELQQIQVDAAHGGMRLDAFVRNMVPALSRRAVQEAIDEGRVFVNGRRASKGTRLQPGAMVTIVAELVRELEPNSELPVTVVHEDDHLVAVNKPAGLPSHALRPFERNTVANFLLAHYPEMRALSRAGLEAGLVHRLDTDTSGVLLAARTPEAHRHLREQFAAREVRKEYLALVSGTISEPGAIRSPLENDPSQVGKMRLARSGSGRAAETHYRPLECYSGHTLLRVDIYSGLRHQIRAHLAAIGHPIVGDALYGGDPSLGLKRQFLHATRISFRHPVTVQLFAVEAPVPEELSAVLGELRKRERQIYKASRPRRR
ncbi:MAG: RluA family pseudouridine synthase [Candidatus Binatia bacterium]|nr:RluA family pseudouridine synthase [Candidatus Binatia bacterium]